MLNKAVCVVGLGYVSLYTLLLGFYVLYYKLKINIANINKETFQKPAKL